MKTVAFSTAAIASSTPENSSSVVQQVRMWLSVLHRVNSVLSGAGWLHMLLLPGVLLALAVDERLVTNVNPWIKPIKFIFSDIIYVWSLGWLLADLPAAAQRAVRLISWGVAVSIVVEIGCIVVQAARGTTSHYNVHSLFDGLLFGLMGVFIALNTVLIMWAVYLVWRHRPHGPASYVWGVRLGLLLFLVGSAVGGAMIGHLAHTVGAPDGGPGLPGVGWSTRAGDLRIAHFLGLHALQALPLVGWLLSRYAPRQAVAGTWTFTFVYLAGTVWLYGQAMQGIPLWAAR
ncbi:hypothetical protein MTX78_15980 [Hymenobacter tibetensis]|uniref:DUF2306 domain-containing protein n=1 Tax=Hymenobacter tibetensis TaxID=497967 RepID=A0ABY4CX97_9BACT|nr:hypothetical protein [Hymenobacter tibetensis]UOG73619.1 hypothetical protein MTX78_15980 [Hymenobacter tibetensis]